MATRQTTVIDASQYFEPHYAAAYTEYDPEPSQLLDEMGIIDRDGDGKGSA